MRLLPSLRPSGLSRPGLARGTALLLAAASSFPGGLSAQQAPADVILDSTFLAGYRWRNIGPDRGGRSIAVSGVRGRPQEAYFGATGGGLWKTTDGGEAWLPVTDFQVGSASVGAVAVSESNPDLVFIGMGETCIRGNILPGDGVYRSRDAGKTWEHVGFAESHGISKIRIHPTDPDIVFVASFGKYSVPSQERGVFKSTDGGTTWKRVLFRDDKTGAIDLAIDRNDPEVMYAALWEAYRKEYQMSSGGPGSGRFKSTDGGETWKEITRNPGLPREGMVGRIGIAVSGAGSERVYALVENDAGGLFSSGDGGATWTLVNDNRAIRQRAFYYTHVFAAPKDADVVYLQNTALFRSTDGGKTTASIGGGTHGDFHDMWIDPDDPAHLVVGNDGGGAVSTDTGKRWTDQDISTAQFYHAVTTAHVPYHVCGSQQDNSTLCVPFNWNAAAYGFGAGGRRGGSGGPPAEPAAGGMAFAYEAGGGEPGYIAPDPLDLDVFYSGTNNGGYVDKYNRRLGTSREVNPYPWFYSGEPAIEIRERWQWTFPIVFSPLDPKRLYVSSQRLWMTGDGGKTWTALSGDLTRHDPATLQKSGGPITGDMNGPEVYATIFSVAPGKTDVNVIWTGSDDGLVHVTRDGGKTWVNVTPPGMPDFGRVSLIEASAFDPATAYVAVKRPLLDDFVPYVFRTHDFGRTWTKIVDGIRADAYVHAVREDPTRRGLLYAGTQHGVYVSYDDGAHWRSLDPGLPDLPIVSVVVEDNELVISAHGRGFWVLDHLAPVRQADATLAAQAVKLFEPPTAVRSGPGVTLSWWLKEPAKAARLEILDGAGKVLRAFESAPERRDSAQADSARAGGAEASGGFGGSSGPARPNRAGINFVHWDLRTTGFTTFPGMILWGARSMGPAVPPGRYTVRLTTAGRAQAAPLTVERNPWTAGVTGAGLVAQYEFSTKVRDKVTEANDAVVAIRRVKAQLDDRHAKSSDAALRAAGEKLNVDASAVEERIYQVRNRSGQDPLNFPIKVNNRLANLLAMAERGDGRPGNMMAEIFDILTAELKTYLDQLGEMWRTDLVRVNAELARLGLAPLDPACDRPAGCLVSQ
ncbi:MAG: glycosyl hydrolase [Gemmatimonadetes bacterium]|nr:glycosyl hydrolase [Gemmatimonadota bacterium]